MSSVFYAQAKSFELTEENPELNNQYVVFEKDSMSISDGYNIVLDWINITYNTPKEVIKAQLKDEYIRIEGFNSAITSMTSLGLTHFYSGKYSITFEFKENKIKMELTKLQVYTEPTQFSAGSWSDINPSLVSTLKKNGKQRKSISQYVFGFVDSIDDLRLSLNNYVVNEKKSVVKKDDW
jgi:hypothetical protein